MSAASASIDGAMSPHDRLNPRLQGFKELLIGEADPGASQGIPCGTTLLISGPPGAGKTTFALSLARSLMPSKGENEPKRILYFISSEINLRRLRGMFWPLGWFCPPESKHVSPKLFRINSPEPDVDNLYVIVPEPATDRPVPSAEELVNEVFNRIAKSLAPGESEVEEKEVIVVVDSITALLKGCASPSDERRQTHELLHRLRSLFSEQRLILTILLAEQDFSSELGSHIPSVEDYLADIVFRLYHKVLPLGRRGRVLEIVKSQGVNMIPGEHTWDIVTNANCERLFRHKKFREHVETLGKLDGDGIRWGSIAFFPRPRLLHASLSVIKRDATIASGTTGLDQMMDREAEHWLPRRASRETPTDFAKLKRGTTTLIAGPLGAGKTTLCMQFLLDPARRHFSNPHAPPRPPARAALLENGTRKDFETAPRSLLVCLNIDAKSVVDAAWRGIEKAAAHAQEDVPTEAKEESEPWRPWLAVLDFTQSHFDFNHLIAHLDWALTNFAPQRIAFDGISEWLAMFDRPDAAKMLEAISIVIANHPSSKLAAPTPQAGDHDSKQTPRRAAAVEGEEDGGRPTVFMTYEMATEDDPLAPQALGVNAENIIALKQITIQDEIRKVIYVLKSDNSAHDPTVRELAYENGRFHVRSGLDSFNGLLRGRTEPAEALLQLFRENHAEQTFNLWLMRRLEQLSHLRFKALDFSRSEIGRLLEDTDSQTRFPAADLKILSVDEWWLNSLPSERTRESPLLNLKTMWEPSAPLENGPCTSALAPSWHDFWIFEVDKAGPNGGKDFRYAVPGYMDFGMFCVNLKLLEDFAQDDTSRELLKCPSWVVQPDRRLIAHLGVLRKARRRASLPRRGSGDPMKGVAEAQAQLWPLLLRSVPRVWVNSANAKTDGWFAADDSEPSVVGLLRAAREYWKAIPASDRPWGFAFDTATRETVVCVFFEIAWAFGADEEFLHLDEARLAEREKAGATAIKFLQFLVLEELMPARSTVNTTRRSLFSRHFYSTLQSVTDLDRWDAHGRKKDDEWPLQAGVSAVLAAESPVPPPHPYAVPLLMALPFFPSGRDDRQRGKTFPQVWCRISGCA